MRPPMLQISRIAEKNSGLSQLQLTDALAIVWLEMAVATPPEAEDVEKLRTVM